MFSRFFIDRPIFATVLSLVITLAGGIAVFTLPVTQYPEITPPTVEVSAVYPGANAQVVSDTVAAPIEQQVNGVEGMLYMSSQCTNDGTYTLTVTFRNGTDLNLAQVLVQNRVSLAQPILPELVRRRGVDVRKKSPTVLMIVNLYSPDGTRDNLYLSNYAKIQLRDELSRLGGVGDITFMGQRDYSMRIWLDPQKMAENRVSAEDVTRAVEQQNVQVAAGQIGQPPAPSGQVFQYTLTTLGRLTDEDQFNEIIIRSEGEGRLVRLKDVGHAELGALGYDQICTLNGKPSVALSVYQLPGSNALQTAQGVRSKMEELRGRFPDGVDFSIVYDTTPFINESVNEVFHALWDAVFLVAIVVLVFLQGWRAAIIPLVAVPVAIIGTFAAMSAANFSLNTLTLFGLVLAIGIVVDDAIVVVEAIETHIERGESPREAAIQAMNEVSGPVIAVGLVLSAVFVPCAFITGIVGQFFRQFALTIAISTVISAFNSLTLSPALAVLLLKPKGDHGGEALPRPGLIVAFGYLGYRYLGSLATSFAIQSPEALSPDLVAALPWAALVVGLLVGWSLAGTMNRFLGWFFRAFNAVFTQTTNVYVGTVGKLLRVTPLVLLLYGGLLALTWGLFERTPTGFIPAQDKGYLLVNVRLPESASLARTSQVMEQIEKIATETEGVRHTVSIAGQSILLGANAANFGSMYVMLDDFANRADPTLTGEGIASTLRRRLDEQIPDGLINVLGAPPVEGLGTAGGFKIVIEDRGDNGLIAMQEVADAIVAEAEKNPSLTGVFTTFRADSAWLHLDIDRTAARSAGVSMGEIFNTLQVYLGSLYVNDFNRFGRTWQVNLQADARFRMQADDLRALKVRNEQGRMVPLASVLSIKEVSGPVMLNRYNLYNSALINANAAEGASSGEAIQKLEQIARKNVSQSMRPEWTELALLQQLAGNSAMYAFVLAVVLVFLVLAAQYESWSLPLAVILVVPMCLLCSIVGVLAASMDVNIFTQIGFVVLVGLACKNAILIVEYARAERDAGVPRFEVTLAACRLRLRPIIMTSLAFIFGVVPLMIGHGAGAEMRHMLGTAVFSGMLGVTLFGIFLTPVFFYAIQWYNDRRIARRQRSNAMAEPALTASHGTLPPPQDHELNESPHKP